MILIVDPFGKIDEIRNGSWLLFNRCFFIMIIDKVQIVGKNQG